MTIRTNDGVCEKVARMVQKGPPDNSLHKDLAIELHNLAVEYQYATAEPSYSKAVDFVLSHDRALREAYAKYSRHGDSMSIELPVRNSKADESRHHDVAGMIFHLAQDHMRKRGSKSLSEATHAVLAERPELASAYAKLTSAR